MLEPAFNPEILEYNAEIENDIDSLNILAIPQRENATVEITGNENLEIGENIISIRVLAENGISEKTYTIKVNKKQEELEEIPVQEKTEEDKKGFWWIIPIIFIFVTIVVAIVYYFRRKVYKM